MKLVLAILVGLLGGFAEFFLLRRTVNAMLDGKAGVGMLMFFAKLAVLFAALLPVAFICPDKLGVCGLCLALPLVVCSSIAFFKTKGADKSVGDKTEDNSDD